MTDIFLPHVRARQHVFRRWAVPAAHILGCCHLSEHWHLPARATDTSVTTLHLSCTEHSGHYSAIDSVVDKHDFSQQVINCMQFILKPKFFLSNVAGTIRRYVSRVRSANINRSVFNFIVFISSYCRCLLRSQESCDRCD